MKLFKILALAGVAAFLGGASAQAAPMMAGSNVCGLINQLGDVFKILRTLAFAGAAFVLAGWAWTFISKGYDADDATKLDKGIKQKGIGMLIGFGLLFGLGLLMTFLPGSMDCPINW